jgi:hypothetical protein
MKAGRVAPKAAVIPQGVHCAKLTTLEAGAGRGLCELPQFAPWVLGVGSVAWAVESRVQWSPHGGQGGGRGVFLRPYRRRRLRHGDDWAVHAGRDGRVKKRYAVAPSASTPNASETSATM